MKEWLTIASKAMPASTQEVVEEHGSRASALLEAAISEALSTSTALPSSPERFAAWIGGRVGEHRDIASLERWFERLEPGDLYLACLCADGDSVAIAAFERRFRPDIDVLTRRFEDRTRGAQDLEQILFEKLFVGDNPRIREYAGLGYLQNWLRVTATRTFIDAKRGQAQQKREDLLAEGLSWEVLNTAASVDVELEFLKQTYQAEFKAALGRAIASLAPEQRTLLRQNVIERRGIRELGQLYGMHHSTVARRLEHARASLYKHTRRTLLEELEVSNHQLDSILALIRSRLDMSVERLLGDSGDS